MCPWLDFAVVLFITFKVSFVHIIHKHSGQLACVFSFKSACLFSTIIIVMLCKVSTLGFPELRGAGDPGHFSTPKTGVFRPSNPVVSGWKNFR